MKKLYWKLKTRYSLWRKSQPQNFFIRWSRLHRRIHNELGTEPVSDKDNDKFMRNSARLCKLAKAKSAQ